MRRGRNLKIIIAVLSGIIVIQWFIISSLIPKKKVKEIAVKPKLKGKIAIVIDDLGYNLNNLRLFQQLNSSLTVSVLPNLAFSREIAEKLNKQGFEIILHLPMQPQEKRRLEQNTILTSFSEERINKIIEQDLGAIVYARGVSNHMGSLATEDVRTMTAVFGVLKKRGLFFLDSVVSSGTICFNLAKKTGIPFAKRDIFLDNENNAEYITRQIYKLKVNAKQKGSAIGIGHDRSTTLQVLIEQMPKLEKEGYKFVFVSDLVK
jgi:uncharacterized protein